MQRFARFLLVGIVVFQLCSLVYAEPHAQRTIGGTLNGMILDGDDMLLAEGQALIRMPLIGVNAYQITERLELGHSILDLAQHPESRVIYALTAESIMTISADGRRLFDEIPGGGQRLRSYRDWLVVAAHESGVRLLPVHEGGVLRLGHLLDTPGSAQDAIITEQGWLAIADGVAGLRLYDPNSLTLLSALPDVAPALQIASSGDRLYVAGDHTVTVVDASTPANPRTIGRYAPLNSARNAVVLEQWAVIASQSDGLKIYSMPDLKYVDGQSGRPAADVQLVGSNLVAAEMGGLIFYDVSSLPALVETARVELPIPPVKLVAEGNWLVAGHADGSLTLLELETLDVVGTTGLKGVITGLEIYGNTIYITMQDGRLVTLRVDAPGEAPPVIPLNGSPQSLDRSGEWLVVASDEAGFYIISLENPAAPRITELIEVATSAQSAEFINDEQLVLVDGVEVRVYSTATWLETARLPALSGRISVGDNRILIADGSELTAYSVTTGTLAPLSHGAAPDGITGLQALIGELVIASRSPGYTRLDVRDSASPAEAETRQLVGGIEHFFLRGDDLFVIDTAGKFQHWRVRKGARTMLAGQYQPLAPIQKIVAGDDKLLLLGEISARLDTQTGVLQRLEVPSARFAASVGGNTGILAKDGHLTLFGPDGSVRHLEAYATALTASSQAWWFGREDGTLWKTDPETAIFEEVGQTNEVISTLAWGDGRLYVGTQNGKIMAWEGGSVVNTSQELGDAVRSIVPSQGNFLAVITQTGALRLLDGDLHVVNQLEGYFHAAAPHPEEALLAVAEGNCGIRILALPELNEFTRYDIEDVTDLTYSGTELWVIQDGLAIKLDASGDEETFSQPYAPSPADGAVVSGSVDELRWLPGVTSCSPYRYEISINGGPGITLQEATYRPKQPLTGDNHWQIWLIFPDGRRINGPEWEFNTMYEGWLAAPQDFQGDAELHRPDAQAVPSALLGSLVVGVGLLGLAFVLRDLWRNKKSRLN